MFDGADIHIFIIFTEFLINDVIRSEIKPAYQEKYWGKCVSNTIVEKYLFQMAVDDLVRIVKWWKI